jgi:hypothetical protein
VIEGAGRRPLRGDGGVGLRVRRARIVEIGYEEEVGDGGRQRGGEVMTN